MPIANNLYSPELEKECIAFMRSFVRLYLEYGSKVGKTQSLSVEVSALANNMMNDLLDETTPPETIVSYYRDTLKIIVDSKLTDSTMVIPLMLCLKELPE